MINSLPSTDPDSHQDGEGASQEALPEGAQPRPADDGSARHGSPPAPPARPCRPLGRRAAPPALLGLRAGRPPRCLGGLGPHGILLPAAVSPCDPGHLGGSSGICKVRT